VDLKQFLEDVHALNKSPVDFDVGGPELLGFFRESCREEAENWLWYLRKVGGGDDCGFGALIRQELKSGELQLADIGTSEEELTRLREKKMAPAETGAAALKMLDEMTVQFDAMLDKLREEQEE